MKTTSNKRNQHFSPGFVARYVAEQLSDIKNAENPLEEVSFIAFSTKSFSSFINQYELHEINNQKLLQAFCHPSFINELNIDKNFSYERMELLGDSVLELLVTEILLSEFKEFSEGELSKLRGQLVSKGELARLGKMIGLEELIFVGRGEITQEIYSQDSILADVFESLLGVIYINLGLQGAKKFLAKIIDSYQKNKQESFFAISRLEGKNYKGRLQEFLMKQKKELPKYTDVELPNGEFMVSVTVNEQVISKSINKSKKNAQIEAAKSALEFLTQ